MARALQANASAVILGHNHPSGAAEASESDRLFTEYVLKALKPIGVNILDHAIIGAYAAFSFADKGLTPCGCQPARAPPLRTGSGRPPA